MVHWWVLVHSGSPEHWGVYDKKESFHYCAQMNSRCGDHDGRSRLFMPDLWSCWLRGVQSERERERERESVCVCIGVAFLWSWWGGWSVGFWHHSFSSHFNYFCSFEAFKVCAGLQTWASLYQEQRNKHHTQIAEACSWGLCAHVCFHVTRGWWFFQLFSSPKIPSDWENFPSLLYQPDMCSGPKNLPAICS
jgi:hypothetical protein